MRTSNRSGSRPYSARVSQTLEPPDTDPYVRWCGRGGVARLPPIPIKGRSARPPGGESKRAAEKCERAMSRWEELKMLHLALAISVALATAGALVAIGMAHL